ncbi:hypothetical protein Pmar_PMAR013449, partial [Perkinsus marinus ATCC 50983]
IRVARKIYPVIVPSHGINDISYLSTSWMINRHAFELLQEEIELETLLLSL